MRLITRFEMAAKSESELYSVLKETFNELAKSEPDTIERTIALASIENIQREIGSRAPSP